MDITIIVISSIAGFFIAYFIGNYFSSKVTKNKIAEAELNAKNIIKDAENEAKSILKEKSPRS